MGTLGEVIACLGNLELLYNIDDLTLLLFLRRVKVSPC